MDLGSSLGTELGTSLGIELGGAVMELFMELGTSLGIELGASLSVELNQTCPLTKKSSIIQHSALAWVHRSASSLVI
jgi:hypothetical protein